MSSIWKIRNVKLNDEDVTNFVVNSLWSIQSNAFDRSVKGAPNSLPLSADSLNLTWQVGNAAYCTPYENHFDYKTVCHQDNHNAGYELIFHISLEYF